MENIYNYAKFQHKRQNQTKPNAIYQTIYQTQPTNQIIPNIAAVCAKGPLCQTHGRLGCLEVDLEVRFGF